MTKKEKVLTGLECCMNTRMFDPCPHHCPYYPVCLNLSYAPLLVDCIELLKEQEKEIKALRLLVEWAEECGFGFDQFQDEYERYKDEIEGMKHVDGMIHAAKRTLEDHGAFEEGR